jgi:arginyl-tRNA--protein-N-Asp/Glu arginylyltransferase
MYVPEGIAYIEQEPSDSLDAIYNDGYLPYSGSKKALRVFYRARSARVRLKDFTLSSENRRIAKKFDGSFTKKRLQGPPPKDAVEFCLAYFRERHGPDAMPQERLEVIFAQVTNTIEYRQGDRVIGYVVSIEGETFGHYWYSFYDLSLARQSLGMWLMLDAIRDAQAQGKSFYYLGTVYGSNALYKANFTPLEWWDGQAWNTDTKLLRQLTHSD